MTKMIETKEHEIITGDDYKKLIINAAQSLEDSKEEINELNVFPVPDGDTGSNMCLTVAEAAKELEKSGEMSLAQTAGATAKAMLHGARGNSGVITSLLFRGIAKGLENTMECDGKGLAKSLKIGVEAAYTAVDRPAEGTILTVARRSADAAMKAAEEKNSFEYVLAAAICEAEVALDETISQNPVLEKAGVVDAGGMGWVIIMKAMHQALTTNMQIKFHQREESSEPKERADFSAFDTEDIKFAFCTEFIVTKHEGDSDTSELRSYLGTVGDSIVMIDDGEIIKVHVHTNVPHEVLGVALKYGVYETVKVENMHTQHTSKIAEAPAKESRPSKKYGFVSVANGQGIVEIYKELGVDQIVVGGQTMNPSTEDLYEAVCKVDAEIIYILPNNKNIILTASQVSELSDKEIIVIPTRSIPQGITAILSFNEECEADENAEAMKEAISGVLTMQITYAARNSSFDGMDIKEGDYLSLCNDKLLCSGNSIDCSIEKIASKINEEGKSIITIYYGEGVEENQAKELVDSLSLKLNGADINLCYGGQPVYYYVISVE